MSQGPTCGWIVRMKVRNTINDLFQIHDTCGQTEMQ